MCDFRHHTHIYKGNLMIFKKLHYIFFCEECRRHELYTFRRINYLMTHL